MIKAKIVSILKFIWVVAVIAGGIFYFVNNYTVAINYFQTINALKLIIAFFLILIVKVLTVDLVKRSLRLVDWNPDFKQVFSFVSISQLGKYIPGGIWQFVARFTTYKENGITTKNMGKAFAVENIWLILGSFLVSIFFILIGQPEFLLHQFNISLSVNIQIFLACFSLFLWFLTLLAIEFLVRSKNRKPSFINVFKQFISQTGLWIIFGVSFFLLFNKIGSLDDLLFCIGAFGLSFLAGYIVIIAPGGIGVREYVAVFLFSFKFSGPEIGVYTIVHRFLYTLAEFILAVISLLIIRKNKTLERDLQQYTVQKKQNS